MLIPLYGAVGAAYASTISYLVEAIIFGFVYAHLSNLQFWDLFLPQASDFSLSTWRQ